MEEQQNDITEKSIPLDTQFQLAIREQRSNELLVRTFASFTHPIRTKSSSSREPTSIQIFPLASTL
jgi:DNA-binding FadR family transcriptional regulator